MDVEGGEGEASSFPYPVLQVKGPFPPDFLRMESEGLD